MKRGCEICLDANISGSPYPEITWYWNNQVIQPEPLRKRPEKPLKKKVEKKEEKKETGEAEKKEEKEGEKKETGEAEKTEEKEVKEGEEKKEGEKAEETKKEEEAAAEPEVEETDYPTINERLAIDNSRRGTSSIVIRDSIRADHGVYMVKVKNNHGTASATCEVNVLGENSSLLI